MSTLSLFVLHPPVHLYSLVAHDAGAEEHENTQDKQLIVRQPLEAPLKEKSIPFFQHVLQLRPQVKLPLVPFCVRVTRHKEGVGSVCFLPGFDGESVQVLQRFAVGQWELKVSVLSFRSVDDESWQAAHMHVLAHVQVFFCPAVKHGYDRVEWIRDFVKRACESAHYWS